MAERRLFEDTDQDAERVLVEGYRRMSAARKASLVRAMSRFIHRAQMLETQTRFPESTHEELESIVRSRFLSAEDSRAVASRIRPAKD